VKETEGREHFGRPRLRKEYNIKVDIKEVGWVAWTRFTWFRM
jgi:hypothetical protein